MNFNIDDHVVDLTNIDQWRHDDTFKAEIFAYDFHKKVISTDAESFIVRSHHPVVGHPHFSSDDFVFSQFSGLNEDKSRVLFNLNPHLKALGKSMRENVELQTLHAALADGDADDFVAYVKAFKNNFLSYFDRIHEGFDTSKMVE